MERRYDIATDQEARKRVRLRGFMWHTLNCACDDCLDADWAFSGGPYGMAPGRLFECFPKNRRPQ